VVLFARAERSVQAVSGSASHLPLTGPALVLSILIITTRCSASVAASQHIKLIIGLLVKKGLALRPSDFPAQPVRAWEDPPWVLIIKKTSMTRKTSMTVATNCLRIITRYVNSALVVLP